MKFDKHMNDAMIRAARLKTTEDMFLSSAIFVADKDRPGYKRSVDNMLKSLRNERTQIEQRIYDYSHNLRLT